MKIFSYSIAVIALVFATTLPAYALSINGFAESAYGSRISDDTTREDSYNLLEGRLQLKGAHSPRIMEEWAPELSFKVELLADGYDERLEFIVREAALSFTPTDTVDVRLGRQVLTWGTGDLLFINDLFPKDYISFFTGRDDEYLKLPSDALKGSVFTDLASFDIVLMPVMEANNSVTGTRVSFYDGLKRSITGEAADRDFIRPEETTENIEIAIRGYKTVGSFEAALYYFRGFYKEPRGIVNATAEDFFYPKLSVYGASLRGPALGGIANMEAGYYHSREDKGGDNPLIENSSVKLIAGYSRDLGGDLSVGVQYMVEEILDYSSYKRGLSAGEPARDELRQLATLRLMKLMKNQTVTAGLFVFFSPTERDAYLRPSLGYTFTDAFKVTAGANIFTGKDDHTEFGQFDRNDNIYIRARYNF